MARRVQVDEDALVAAYQAGAGLATLQEDFGINRMTARKILLERGVTIRRPGRPSGGESSPKTTTESVPEEAQAPDVPRPFQLIHNPSREV
jgi:hypothetical protein